MAVRGSHRGVSSRALQEATGLLRVLAHPLRIRILERLTRSSSPLTVGELVHQLRQPQHTVSHHLNRMYLHDILARSRRGREVYYRVRSREALKLLQWVQQYRREEGWLMDGEAI